jgi:hypothetical protein
MNPLIINTPAKPVVLYTGELSMVRIPSRKYGMNSWIIGDAFMRFSQEIIQRAIENLVVNGVITCTWYEKESNTFTLFSRKQILDHLRYNEAKRIEPAAIAGFLEKVILKNVMQFPGITTDDLFENIFAEALGSGITYTNPGKQFVAKVIEANTKSYWTFKHTKRWFSEKMALTFQQDEQILSRELAEVDEQVTTEKNNNLDFNFFSKRLAEELGQSLGKWHDSD